MVRSRRTRRNPGITGTSMTMHRLPKRPPLERNEHLCPVCFSVPGQPCRKVLPSPPGSKKLKLGGALSTTHSQRPGASSASISSVSKRRARTSRTVDIERIDPDRAGFVPRNQRNLDSDSKGNKRTAGWSRDNDDALPRRTSRG